jgi:hypothetical protein
MSNNSKFINLAVLAIACFTILPSIGLSQQLEKKAIWMPFKNFIGTWKGKIKQLDTYGTEELSFNYYFDSTYIEVKCKKDYEADVLFPKGHTEESIGYINYDSRRKIYIYRQFAKNTSVIQFKLTSATEPNNMLLEFCEDPIESGGQEKEIFRMNKMMELNHKTQIKFKDAPDLKFITFPEAVLKKL